jgi:hypothetical protein
MSNPSSFLSSTAAGFLRLNEDKSSFDNLLKLPSPALADNS